MLRLLTILTLLPLATLAHCQIQESAAPELFRLPTTFGPAVVSPAEVTGLRGNQDYRAISRKEYARLLDLQADKRQSDSSVIQRAEYSAVLAGDRLIEGTVKLLLEQSESPKEMGSFLVLGATSLSNLRLSSSSTEIELATDSLGQLRFLRDPDSRSIEGRWMARGNAVGQSMMFDLQLPKTAIAEFTIRTTSDINITSQNALVSRRSVTEKTSQWTLYPSDPTSVTISCTNVPETVKNESQGLTLNVDYRCRRYGSVAKWVVGVPQPLTNSTINFEFNLACDLQSVRLSNGSPLPWAASAENPNGLQVRIPSAPSTVTFAVEAKLRAQNDDVFDLPFLTPRSWKPIGAENENELMTRSATIRASVSPDAIVTNVEVQGLFESDVQYGTDGSQILNFRQFAQMASARLLVVDATPVIEDSVVIDEMDEAPKATAYVSVVARSGTTGSLEWTIPSGWQVIDVQDAEREDPLLFRMSDAAAKTEKRLTVTLRRPIPARGRQTLQIQMQSTGGQSVSELPQISNSQYHRKLDLIIPGTSRRGINPSTGASGMSIAKLKEDFKWLPQDRLAEGTAWPRESLRESSSAATNEKFNATVDYSVGGTAAEVRETLDLKLRSNSSLPLEVEIRATPDVPLSVSNEFVAGPAPTLKRVSTGRRHDDWILSWPANADVGNSIDVRLTALRPLSDSMATTMIEVPQGTVNGGAIRPPAADAEFRMRNNEKRNIQEVAQYPIAPLDRDLRLEPVTDDSSRMKISGKAFLITTADQASGVENQMPVDACYQLMISARKSPRSLAMKFPETEAFRVFLDGRPIYAERTARQINIPLPGRDEASILEIFTTAPATRNPKSELQIPIIQFPDTDDVHVTCFLLTSRLQSPVANEAGTFRMLQAIPFFSGSIDNIPSDATTSEVSRQYETFGMRWKIHTAENRATCLVTASPDSGVLRLQLQDERFAAAKWLISAFLIFLVTVWLLNSGSVIPWCLAAVWMLLLCGIRGSISETWQVFIDGFLWGTVGAGIFALIRRVRNHRRNRLTVHFRSASAVLPLLLFMTLNANGADENPSAEALQSDVAMPIVYVKKQLLEELRLSAASSHDDALVIATNIEFSVLTPTSTAARIRCEVATAVAGEARLKLPLDGLTLVSCSLDGLPVFPTKESATTTVIVIPATSRLPVSPLGAASPDIASNGPDSVGTAVRRIVEYEVRMTTEQRSPGRLRIDMPYPPSPQTKLSVTDRQQLITEVSVPEHGTATPSANRQKYDFPVAFNREALNVTLEFREQSTVEARSPQSCRVICRAIISPADIRLNHQYRVTPSDPGSTSVSLNHLAKHRVISVGSTDGDRLPWAVIKNKLKVNIPTDALGVQAFQVTLAFETPTLLQQTIQIREAATVNGIRADQFSLLTSTTDLFLVESVHSNGKSLTETNAAGTLEAIGEARLGERAFTTTPDVDRIDVRLSRQETSREARLLQTAVVGDSQIEWNCECEIEITGQPAFRQTIRLSPDVQVQEIKASNGEVSRLQAWHRHGDVIVVSLREATRGSLMINISGTVKRRPNVHTALPIVDLSVDILEYSLMLSRSTDNEVYVHDLAGTVPHVPMDIANTPIPASPIALTVTSDRQPLTVRANTARQIQADAAIVIYESEGQTLAAEFLRLQTADQPFRVSLQVPTAAVFSTCKTWVGELAKIEPKKPRDRTLKVRVSADPLKATVLGVTNIVMPRDNGQVSIPIPKFDVERLIVNSVQALDLRRREAENTDVMEWVRKAVATSLMEHKTSPATQLSAEFDAGSRELRVRLSEDEGTPVAGNMVRGLASSTTDHFLTLEEDETLNGETGFLTFAYQKHTPLKISVPEQTVISHVQVNDKPVPFSMQDQTLTVSTAERMSFVTVKWLRQIQPNDSSRLISLPLLNVVGVNSDARASLIIKPKSRWAVDNAALNGDQTSAARLRAATNGLQLIESEFLIRSETTDSDDSDTVENSTGSPVWDQLKLESPQATDSYSRFLEKGIRGRNLKIDREDQNSLRIRTTAVPQFTTVLSLTFALVLLLTPALSRARSFTQRSRGEASTVITSPKEDEAETVVTELHTDSKSKATEHNS